MTSTEPLLLIHGLFGSLTARKILDAFAPGPVLAPDLIGYGEHRTTRGDWTLADQAAHVADKVRASGLGPMHVVGHSVGGAVAVLLSAAYPNLCRSVTSVEGNFTLKDAFWSQQISTQSIEEIEVIVDTYKSDVGKWLSKSIPNPTPWALSVARDWLSNQPSGTLRSQARAVVAATTGDAFMAKVEGLFGRGLPFHLVAGERAVGEWSVPARIVEKAGGIKIIPSTGHLMMLEDPAEFAAAIREKTGGSRNA